MPLDGFTLASVPDSDQVAFSFDFGLEGKALEELEDGDLIIEGWAAEFDGIDRQGENFAEGAFERGIKSFLDGSASLCYHHKREKALGKVLELQEVPGRGLHMKARVDGAIKDHPELGTYYRQIKKGTLTGLSVGGFFGREKTPKGPRINDMDFVEISVTPVAIHPRPQFSVVAGKALTEGEEETESLPIDEQTLATLSEALTRFSEALPEGKAAAEPKGDYDDLRSLALILALEQMTNQLDDNEENDGDEKVDAVIEKVKVCLDEVAKEAHALAAKYGPLPNINWSSEPY